MGRKLASVFHWDSPFRKANPSSILGRSTLIILLVLLLPLQGFAITWHDRGLDKHDPVHLLGSLLMFVALHRLSGDTVFATMATISLCVIWEMLDTLNSKGHHNWKMFDNSGGDYNDILVGALGFTVGIVIISF